MSSEVIKKIDERLQQENWTDVSIETIEFESFEELYKLITPVTDSEQRNAIFELFNQYYVKNDKSVLVLFGIAVVYLQNKSVDDSYLLELLDRLHKAKRWAVLERTCTLLLDFGEERSLLRMLAVALEEQGNSEQQIEIWKRLILVDFNEVGIVGKLAAYCSKQGDTAGAIDYNKKYLLRAIGTQHTEHIKSAWKELCTINTEDSTFFKQVIVKIASILSADDAAVLLEGLIPQYKHTQNWDTAIELLKLLFEFQPENMWARKELAACYEKKYANHSGLADYIQSSNLLQSWRNIREAIADFEKHISFDENNFVFHRSWGVGVIRSIKDEIINIDFGNNKKHQMALKMAVDALEVLPKDHIWVLRSMVKPDKLNRFVRNNVKETLKILMRSFSNSISLRRIRAELVPYVLNDEEWSLWNTKARKILKSDGIFGNVTDRPDEFEIRSSESSIIEKLYNSFVSEKDFNNRTKVAITILKGSDSGVGVSDADLLIEVWKYFNAFVQSDEQITVRRIISILIVEWMIECFPELNIDTKTVGIDSLIKSGAGAVEIYKQLGNKDITKRYIAYLATHIDDAIWIPAFLEILKFAPSHLIIEKLDNRGQQQQTVEMISNIAVKYRTYRESFVWLVTHQAKYPWFDKGLAEKIQTTLAMLHIFDINVEDIQNKKNIVSARKLFRRIHKFLFHDKNIDYLVEHADKKSVEHTIPILNEIQSVEPDIIASLKQRIQSRFPDISTSRSIRSRSMIKTDVKMERFYTLGSSLLAKQEELRQIHEIEVPKNSKEIQKALEKGDLSENAEYKSAKEQQDILNSNAMRLEMDLKKAIIFDESNINQHEVGFGCVVTMKDNDSGEEVRYNILGPWESDPDNLIISYQSPLGSKLQGAKVDETREFSINNKPFSYKIVDISYPSGLE